MRVVHSEYWELDNPVLAEINRSTFLLFLEKTTVVLYRTQLFNELNELFSCTVKGLHRITNGIRIAKPILVNSFGFDFRPSHGTRGRI